MASLLVLPSLDFELPSSVGSYNNCRCVPRRLGPLRPRYQRRHRWSPFELPSRFLEFIAEDPFEEGPSVVVCRKRTGDKPQQSETTKPSESTSTDVSEQKGPVQENFKISLEIGNDFTPEELSVKVVDDRTLRIEGKHEEKGEDGDFSFRQFTRSYHLGDDVDIKKLNSRLSEEGVLIIEAPRFEKKAVTPVERNIPIEQREKTPSPTDAEKITAESQEEETKKKETEDEPKDASQEKDKTTKPEEEGSHNAE